VKLDKTTMSAFDDLCKYEAQERSHSFIQYL